MIRSFWIYGTDLYRIPGYESPTYHSYRRDPSWWGINLSDKQYDQVADLIELRPRPPVNAYMERPASSDRPWSYRAEDELKDEEDWLDLEVGDAPAR